MATSFAAFASQYLSKNQQQQQGSSSLSSSQPIFFSFTTDDGSRHGGADDSDVDDFDDPHMLLRGSSARHAEDGDDDDDPYLRLDEDDHLPGSSSRYASQSIPLIASERGSPDSPKAGWLAHQASPLRSPSPSSSSTDSAIPPPDLLQTHTPARYQPPPPPQTSRGPHGPVSLSLTQSLLPRDGTTRPMDVFSLPDPRHTPRSRRKYNDSIWTSLYLCLLSLCLLSSFLTLFLTHKPSSSPPRASLPYTTLLHTVPLLTILTFTSAAAAYAHVWLLRVFVRPVMVGTSVFIPATLFVSAVWAFIGSFMWDGDKEPTWGETVGLRLFSLIPLALSLLTARRLLNLPRQIHTTSSLLDLTTTLLLLHPFLLLLSPLLLLTLLLLSIPFITLIFRLLLIGYYGTVSDGGGWHVAKWAGWAIVGSVAVWLWSWGVVRGVLRVTCAGVIGAWYFADPTHPPPSPTSTHTLHASITRALSPSLGSIILSSLLLTLVRLLTLLTLALRALPYYLPPALRPVAAGASLLAGYAEGATSALSGHALVYVGLTGDPFLRSARRVRVLAEGGAGAGGYKRRFKTEPPLTLLTIAPLTLAFPFALLTYLFVAHTLGAPASALGAALLAGGVTSAVGVFCVGVVRDTADTLYVCYCIDRDVGERRRAEVFEAFEYERPRQPPAQPQTQGSTRPAAIGGGGGGLRYERRPQDIEVRPPPSPLPPPQQQRERGGYASPPRERDTPTPRRAHPLSPPPPPVSASVSGRVRSPTPVRDVDVDVDVDPFTRSYEIDPSGSGSGPLRGYDVDGSTSGPRKAEEEEEEEEQLFPGSDFF